MSVFPFALAAAPAGVVSSYTRDGRTGQARALCIPLSQAGGGLVAPDVAAGLLALSEAVLARRGDFRVTDCHRDAAVQARARARYDTWVAAGKPAPGTAGWVASTMKAAFVALPGKSGHNGGRSIDCDTGALRFSGVAADRQIDVLWECAAATGWTPVIGKPTEGAAESWHFDYRGELQGVYDRLGYEQWALAGAVLVGHAGTWQSPARAVQALLQRAGYDIGEIDGAPGPRTRAGITAALGTTSAADVLRAAEHGDWCGLDRLAASPRTLWRPAA